MWNPSSFRQQQGSFVEPVPIPAADPMSPPFVCIQVNQEWLPYVIGALMQLVQPTSWLHSTEAELQEVLARATDLIGVAGNAELCVPISLQFTETCALQYSRDGGATWLDVPGWAGNAGTCFRGPAGTDGAPGPRGLTGDTGPRGLTGLTGADGPPGLTGATGPAGESAGAGGGPPGAKGDPGDRGPAGADGRDGADGAPGEAGPAGIQGPAGTAGSDGCGCPPVVPPNPRMDPVNQHACNIAGFLAQDVLQQAVHTVQSGIADTKNQADMGISLINLVPGVGQVAAGFWNFLNTLFDGGNGPNKDHWDAAASDPVLLSRLTCAIYGAILDPGYVTVGNFESVGTAIGAVPYTYPDVIASIQTAWIELGLSNVQAAQTSGALADHDCTSCAAYTWCYEWAAGKAPLGTDWQPNTPGSATFDGTKWNSVVDGGTPGKLYIRLSGLNTAAHYTTVHVDESGVTTSTDFLRFFAPDGSLVLSVDTGDWTGDVTGAASIVISANNSAPWSISGVTIHGPGTNPFGASNC